MNAETPRPRLLPGAWVGVEYTYLMHTAARRRLPAAAGRPLDCSDSSATIQGDERRLR
jgi:hypothetical protein